MTAEAWRAELEAAKARYAPVGVSSVDEMKRVSGLDFLRGILEGRVPPPPMAHTLDFHLVEVAEGRAVWQGEPGHAFYNPIGSVHGGWAATLLDSCMGCAVQSTLPQGQGYITVDIKVNLIRPLSHATGPVRAIGTIVNSGRTIAIAEGKLVGPEGRLYAHGTSTCMVFPL
jgi:uncharacterized protein (TIGR00369 family)